MNSYILYAAFFRSRPFRFIAFGWLIIPLLYWYLLSRSEKITIGNGELIYESGILRKDRTELKLSHIRTVKVSQDLIDRIFGCGNLLIFTSGDLPEVTLIGFPNPNVIRDVIKGG
jgi:uncharacterized membrane protein YdbT with pleckstrin-like domain